MLRQIRDDARDFPATFTLCILWVVVFAGMVTLDLTHGRTVGQAALQLQSGFWFGDMTPRDLVSGQVWRGLTATFVHYNALHIGLNLYAFYQLGCLVESWYGSGQFIGIYVLTGGVGNLISGLGRWSMDRTPYVACGGGSVVVMGLAGLCAVVGWRSRSRLGVYLRDQMLWVLGLTAAIGLILPAFHLPIVDNWGHACGALVGAAIGLAHRLLAKQAGRRSTRWVGYLGALAIAASAVAQGANDQKETVAVRRQIDQARTRWAEAESRLRRLGDISRVYQAVVVAPSRVVPRGALVTTVPEPGSAEKTGASDPEFLFYETVLKASLTALDSMAAVLTQGQTATDFHRLRALIAGAVVEPPTFEEAHETRTALESLQSHVRRDRDQARLQALSPLYRGRRP